MHDIQTNNEIAVSQWSSNKVHYVHKHNEALKLRRLQSAYMKSFSKSIRY